MSIVATPEIKTRGASFGLIRGDIVTARLDGSEAVALSPIAKWRLTAPLVPMSYEQAQPWIGAINQLAAPDRFFDARPPGFALSEYAKANFNGTWQQGEPVLSSASGTTANFTGLVADATFLTRGDYFQITTADGPELKMCVADSASTSGGAATVQFEPALRRTATGVDIINPKCRFRLMDSASYQLRPNRIVDITLEAVETHG